MSNPHSDFLLGKTCKRKEEDIFEIFLLRNICRSVICRPNFDGLCYWYFSRFFTENTKIVVDEKLNHFSR